jgi:hypothetical protein
VSTRRCAIFVSHSAHAVEEPATQKFLDALSKAIQAVPGLVTLVDQNDLQAGDAWLQRLYGWMGLCDAAVILLSPRAVRRENSAWVPREANLLLWRKALDPGFVVIPVLIGGTQRADLAHNPFLPQAGLDDLQMPAGLTDKAKIAKIVKALQAQLAGRLARLAFDPLRTYVEECLEDAPAASVQQVLHGHYGADPWQADVLAHQNLAHKMVRHAVADPVDLAIRDVSLGSRGEDQLGVKLFDALYPMRLPAEAACRLLTLCRQQEGRGAVLVNAQNTWVLRLLMRAASGLPLDDLGKTWVILEVPDDWADQDEAALVPELAQLLADAVLGTGGWNSLSKLTEPEARLKQQQQRLAGLLGDARGFRGAPILLCTAHTDRWASLAAPLAQRFPSTVFVFWTGDELPPAAALPADCVALLPSWPAGADDDWRHSHDMKRRVLGGQAP